MELSGQKQSAGVLASIGGKSEGKLSGYYPRDSKPSADDIHTVNIMSAQIIEMYSLSSHHFILYFIPFTG